MFKFMLRLLFCCWTKLRLLSLLLLLLLFKLLEILATTLKYKKIQLNSLEAKKCNIKELYYYFIIIKSPKYRNCHCQKRHLWERYCTRISYCRTSWGVGSSIYEIYVMDVFQYYRMSCVRWIWNNCELSYCL